MADPQAGEKNSYGETWDGYGWIAPASRPAPEPPVDKPLSFGALDYVPGLRDVLNLAPNIVKGAQALPDVARGIVRQPGATIKGFVKGASEAATPDRLGMLALLTPGLGATLSGALTAAGGESIAQAARAATNAPNAPTSLGDAATSVGEAASVPALAAAVQGVPSAVQRMGGTKQLAGRVLGAGIGGYEGYHLAGAPGAVLGTVGGAMAPDLLRRRSLMGLTRAIGPQAESASTASPRIVDRYRPNVSRVSSEVKGFSMPEAATSEAPGAAIPGLRTPQGTFTKIGDEWGVTGKGLQAGQPVNVSSASGVQRLMKVDKVLTDEHGTQLATLKPSSANAPVDDFEALREGRPVSPSSASMEGLKSAIGDDSALREDAVKRYLAKAK